MNRRGKLYIGLIIFTILCIVLLEMSKPKKINWIPSYVTYHKIPFGSLVVQKLLKKQCQDFNYLNRPPYEILNQTTIQGSYLLYNNTLNFENSELEAILNWTSKGNTLFLASNTISSKLLDTLNLKTRSINTTDTFIPEFYVSLVNPELQPDSKYLFDKTNQLNYFSSIDTLQTTVLGYAQKTSDSKKANNTSYVNLIKQPFGKGEIILSLFPQSFTNYFILKDSNYEYSAHMISYLQGDQPLWLDEYYKSGKAIFTSPMYLFLSNPSLKWAYYSVLIAVIIYLIFEAKRKQRAIPTIEPLVNQTIAFSRTISDMYYHQQKHKKIAHHMILHFLEYIRRKFYLSTDAINQEFLSNLGERSNNSLEDTRALFNLISQIELKTDITEDDLKTLHKKIQTFKSHHQWKNMKTAMI